MKIVSRGEVSERLQCMSDWGLRGSVVKADYVFPDIYVHKCNPTPFSPKNSLKILKHLDLLYKQS